MYPEFIAIYIGLIIIIALLITILVITLKKQSSKGNVYANNFSTYASTETTKSSGGSVVFCKKCAAELDSNQKFCPKCGTPR